MIWKIVLLFSFVFSACAVDDRERDGKVFCTIDLNQTYEIGTNPGTDFNVTNLEKTTAFNSSDCPQVDKDSFTVLISRAKRVNTTVSIIENQFASGEFLLEMQASGTTLLPKTNSVNINGCSIIRRWTGTINTPGTTVTINQVITYKGACQSTFYNPETDGNHPQ